MYVCAEMIFGVFFFFFAEKDLLSHTETTTQHDLWLYHSAVVKGISIVSPSYMYTKRLLWTAIIDKKLRAT